MNILKGKNILIVGAHGMLATDCVKLFSAENASLYLADLKDEAPELWPSLPYFQVDLSDSRSVAKLLASANVDWIVNCAAFTAVDLAETEQETAFAVNENGVENLASEAAVKGVKVCHISTDYVFGGSALKRVHNTPFSEDDDTAPCGVYGKSKFAGEQKLRRLLPESHLILRTSWLFGRGGPNFVATMIKLGKELEEIKVVNDQTGSPTWTGWLAEVIRDLVAQGVTGTFHASSDGNITWHDFAAEIFSRTGSSIKLSSQSTEQMGRPAPRPVFSTMDTSKLEKVLGRECPSWKSTLKDYLKEVGY